MQKALRWKALLDSRELSNQAQIARLERLSRARVTQIMSLLRLAPEIQDYILSLPKTARRPAITERSLRPITQVESLTGQKDKFHELIENTE